MLHDITVFIAGVSVGISFSAVLLSFLNSL